MNALSFYNEKNLTDNGFHISLQEILFENLLTPEKNDFRLTAKAIAIISSRKP